MNRMFPFFFLQQWFGFLRVKGHLLPSPDPTDPPRLMRLLLMRAAIAFAGSIALTEAIIVVREHWM